MAYKTPEMSITVPYDSKKGTSGKISSNQGVHQGVIFFARIIVPDYTEDVLTTVSIIDEAGKIIYSFPNLVKATTHIISDFQCPLIERESLSVELNDVPGGDANYNICVTLYYYRS